MLHRGQELVKAAEIDCKDIEEHLGHLQSSWDTLREAAAGRLQRLRDAHEAQQYYLDAGEAEAWISEQELYVFSDEPPKVHWGRVCEPDEQLGRAVVGRLLESLEIQVYEKVGARVGRVGNTQNPALLWYPPLRAPHFIKNVPTVSRLATRGRSTQRLVIVYFGRVVKWSDKGHKGVSQDCNDPILSPEKSLPFGGTGEE